ncbi:MAG: DUF4340 domain-containing protein, partial [Deltaproteobacteria bacterium]|nr:DUF4340 domain-containing protein [Deltaproteobacteria bacterium]
DRLSVDTAIDKLAGLELESVASRKREKHALLEVDEAHGIHVVARGADKVLADLWIGATRSGNTAVRVNGQDATGMVKGSIRYAFSRDLRDWRDRTILAIEPEEVKEVEWKGPNGYFRFIRPLVEPSLPPDADAGGTPEKTLGDWTIAQVSYVPQPEEGKDAGPPKPPVPRNTIEHFQPSKVRTAVSIIARLRAADFAPSNLTPEEAGINADSPRVTLTTRDGQVAVLRLGKSTKEGDDQFYLMREGEQTIYIISKYHSQRIHPTVSEFEAPPSGSSSNTSKENSEKGEFSTVPRKVEPDEVPPEIMRQLEAQLRERH